MRVLHSSHHRARPSARRSATVRILLALAVLAAGVVIAACGGSAASGEGEGGSATATKAAAGGGGKLTAVTVTVAPFENSAPLYVGIEQGFFKQEGLEVKPAIAQSGPAIVAAVQSGEAQFGDSGTISMLQAQVKGVPVKIVAQAASSARSGVDEGLFAKGEGGPSSVSELKGKTIGLNALKAQNELFVRAALQKEGVDPASVHFVALPVPALVPAIESGQIAAGYLNEPFATEAEQKGARALIKQPAKMLAGPNAMLAVWFTSGSYASQHREVVSHFVKAMNEANEYSEAHPSAIRKVLPSFTGMSASLAGKIALSRSGTEIDRATLEKMGQVMVQQGLVQQPPNVSALLLGG